MKVGGVEAVYHKLVYEVTYEQGFLYLDRCGATLNRIVEANSDWVLREGGVSPQGAPVVNTVTGTQLNFGPFKLDLSLNQPIGEAAALRGSDISAFIEDASAVTAIVQRELDLRVFSREGFRVWYLFGTQSNEESLSFIQSLGGFVTNDRFSQAFGGAVESDSYTVVVAGQDRKFRISVTPVERQEVLNLGTEALKTLPRRLPKQQRSAVLKRVQAKQRLLSNPEFAVMIDVDAYVEHPLEIEPRDFIGESVRAIEAATPIALSRRTS